MEIGEYWWKLLLRPAEILLWSYFWFPKSYISPSFWRFWSYLFLIFSTGSAGKPVCCSWSDLFWSVHDLICLTTLYHCLGSLGLTWLNLQCVKDCLAAKTAWFTQFLYLCTVTVCPPWSPSVSCWWDFWFCLTSMVYRYCSIWQSWWGSGHLPAAAGSGRRHQFCPVWMPPAAQVSSHKR